MTFQEGCDRYICNYNPSEKVRCAVREVWVNCCRGSSGHRENEEEQGTFMEQVAFVALKDEKYMRDKDE